MPGQAPDDRACARAREPILRRRARRRTGACSPARSQPWNSSSRRNIQLMKLWLAAALALTVTACAPSRDNPDDLSRTKSRGEPAAHPRCRRTGSGRGVAPAGSRPRIAVLGDSLTAGLGVAKAAAYPSLLQERLDAARLDFEIVNAGVSGDTSAGGLARLDWALDGGVRILIVALGGNDGLRGLPAERTPVATWLADQPRRAQLRGITVILAGMEAPPNYGRDYIVSFHKVYPALAAKYRVALVPFLLQGVAGDEALNQRDGIHPTAAGADSWPTMCGRSWSLSPKSETTDHMIELRDVSKTVMSGAEPRPSSARCADSDSARTVRRHRRSLRQRQVDAAWSDRRARRPVLWIGPDRRRRHHQARRGCAREAAGRKGRLRFPVLPP